MMATSPNFRTALLAGTALIFPILAQAQPAPNARPQGGSVVAGSATIGGDAGRTVINQTTDRAAINWQSFDVGRNQAVQFQQPSTTSVTLNRVISSNPSQIAGQITANGQIAIVNQSGVIFHQGSTVNAAGLVVSTANITNEAFMAGGRMNFNQPGRPDARIENNGTITVREAGLAALVAPQVANHGVIRARMGRVVLAGAETSVVDLHGDGLLSLEVTSPVRQAPGNGQALVTNTGTVTATGGTVVLTASAVDGIVQDLVRAGGRIAANTAASGQTGRVVIAGNGGNVRVEGEVSAQGLAANTRGGDIRILGDRTLVDATARVNASGRTGGGTIAIGVTPNGAANRRLSQRAGIARGAVVRADATERGNGGTVLLNSTDYTVQAGTVSVQGGPQGGDGGFVEVSSGKDFRITGDINVAAGPGGQRGTLLIDPTNLTVVVGANGSGSDDSFAADGVLGSGETSGSTTISNGFINGFAGNLLLQATNSISVDAPINKPTGNLAFEAGGAFTVTTNGSIVLGAGDLSLTASSFTFNGPVTVPLANAINFTSAATGATITQSADGVITAGTVTQTNPGLFSDVNLGAANNVIANITSMSATTGSISVRNTRALSINGNLNALNDIRLDVIGGDLSFASGAIANAQNGLGVFRATGNFILGNGAFIQAPNLIVDAGMDATLTAIDPNSTAGIFLAGTLRAQSSSASAPDGNLVMNAASGGIQQTAFRIETSSLGIATTGSVSLPGAPDPNRVDQITSLTALGDALIATSSASLFDLTLSGAIQVGGAFTLSRATGNVVQSVGSVITANILNLSFSGNGATLLGNNQVAQLGTINVTQPFDFRNTTNLLVSGPVTVRNAAANIDVVGDLTVTGSIIGQNGVRLRASGNIDLAAGSSVERQDILAPGSGTITILAGFNGTTSDPASATRLTMAGTVGNAGFLSPIVLGAGTGGIVQTGGAILGTSLGVSSGGDALLTGASTSLPNRLSGLSNVAVSGNFSLDAGTSNLLISGGSYNAGIFAIRTDGNVQVSSNVTATERATFRVGSLSITGFSTPVTVTAPLVEIAPNTAVGMVVVPDESSAQPFQIDTSVLNNISTGSYRFGATTFGGVTTTTASEVAFGSSYTFPGTIDARALGDVFQGAGTSLNFGALYGAAGGAFELNEATNVLPFIGDVSAGTFLALRTTGNMVLSGGLAAPYVALTTGGSLTETGAGRIGGGTLALQTGGDALLNGANTLTGLDASNVNGRLELKNTSDELTLPVNRVFFTLGLYDIQQTGSLTVNGTITGTSGRLAASNALQVNNHSAIARTGNLNISTSVFTLNGLLQAAGAINIVASTSASLAGIASGTMLNITSPSVTFNGLNALNAPVLIFLGPNGTTTGSLDTSALTVFGGASANLFGTIAGIGGGAAAATGQRGTQSGTLLSEPLPSPRLYLFNNCPLGASVCSVVVVPPSSTTTSFQVDPYLAPSVNPPIQAAVLDPVAAFSQQLSPPVPVFSFRLYRDRSEEGELAPPNVRGEDF